MNFRDLLGYEESLFQDERVFDPDYIPKDFNFRDNQLKEIAFCLRPALRGGKPINAKVYGPPATGKTTAIKLIFREIEEYSQDIYCVHINCQIHSSKFGIFSQIHKKVVGHLPPETGVPFSKVYDAIFKKLADENKALIVALDDMNYLFYDRYGNEIIYDILRAYEIFTGVRTGVIGVVSDIYFNFKLDAKVRSIFKPHEIFFPPYKYNEIFEILRDRAKLGLYPGVISDDLIEKIATYTFEHGDLRLGIELIRVSALIAESEGSRKITESHVEKAYEKTKNISLNAVLDSLSKEERILVELIPKNCEITSGELYKLFKEKTKLSYTKFYRILDKLEALRIIDSKFTGEGKKGRSRKIFLRV